MPRVSITGDALRELEQRMARSGSPGSILIIGPVEDPAWPASNLEEAWHIEKLYGRRPRWSLHVTQFEMGEQLPFVHFHAEDVGGISVKVLLAVPIPSLSIELHGDVIRVREVDA